MIKSLPSDAKTEKCVFVAMEAAQRSGLIKFLKDDQTPEGISRVENVQELMNSMQKVSLRSSNSWKTRPKFV